MSNPDVFSPDSPFDIALARLRAYVSRNAHRVQEERDALNAIPGYREALAQANASEEARLALIALTPQVAAVQGVFSPRSEERQAERNEVAATFAVLEEDDIRRMIVALSEERGFAMLGLLTMVTTSRNPVAVRPLIERLEFLAGPPNALPARRLLARLIESDEIVRMTRAIERVATIRTLASFGDRRAEAIIERFRDDPEDSVRAAARAAFVRLRGAGDDGDTGVSPALPAL